jgi:hypothetical protein
MPQAYDPRPFHVEHIIAKKHHGGTILDNLAEAGMDCNLAKSSNLSGFDPDTGVLTPLYHPRRERWSEHFEWRGAYVIGKTPVGRTTIDVLNLNAQERVNHRRLLIRLGVFP